MDKVVIIKNQDDAKNYVISKFAPTNREKRIGQAISGGLLGAGLGAGVNYGINGSAKKGLLIGGALGALGGYSMKPTITTEDERNIGGGIISAFNLFYVVGSLPSGEIYYKSHTNLQDAKKDANNLKAQGVNAFVVTPNSFESNRQFGFLKHIRGGSSKADFKRGVEAFGENNKNFIKTVDLKSLPKEAQEAYRKDILTAGQNKVIKEKRFLGNALGSIGGALTGGGLGYLAGKKIAGLKSEEAYIKEYLSKHPGANKQEAQKAYQERLKKFQSIGANVGALGGGYLGSRVGDKLGRKAGIKDARRLSNELRTTGDIK